MLLDKRNSNPSRTNYFNKGSRVFHVALIIISAITESAAISEVPAPLLGNSSVPLLRFCIQFHCLFTTNESLKHAGDARVVVVHSPFDQYLILWVASLLLLTEQ